MKRIANNMTHKQPSLYRVNVAKRNPRGHRYGQTPAEYQRRTAAPAGAWRTDSGIRSFYSVEPQP